jgi:pentatricopeptide repeat protein
MLVQDLGRPDPDSVGINYYEQDPKGNMRKLRDSDEFDNFASGLDTDIETALGDLEQRMINAAKMLQAMEKSGGDQEKAKAGYLKKQFKRTLRRQYKGKTGPEAEEYGLLRITGFSGPHMRTVGGLNMFLARESVVDGGIPKPKDVADCWKYYSAARKTLSAAWKRVPQEVWDFLWMIMSWQGEGVENPNRMQHLYILAKDMQDAGVVLRDSQQLVAIEAMFLEGWEEEAIEAWKKAVVTLGSKPETFTDYHELGVRMLSLHGDTDRAQRVADKLLKSSHPPNARILLPVIRAMASKPATVGQAWEAYADMRTLLGESMTIEDYDEVVAIFLTSDCTEYALQSFVDMMFSGAVDIRGKARLPMMVGNHFFIGKWLKRLIGVGDLEGAYKVAVFVQDKGVAASPIQLNGLIAAWLRSGSVENIEKAEALAWSMIRARLDHVKLRQGVVQSGEASHTTAIAQTEGEADGEPKPEFKCKTRATAETFSILAENYCSRGLHGRLQELFEVLEQAEIRKNSFLMNQLMRSYSQNSQPGEAVELYHNMAKSQEIQTDGHTFLTLFNTLSVNRLVVRDPELTKRDIAVSRQFFREMVQADWTFDSAEIMAQLPRTILFSMLKTQDYAGMIVAARAMTELFGFHPTHTLLIEMASGAGSMQINSKRNMQRLVAGKHTIETLMKRHRLGLMHAGHSGEEMTSEETLNELHDVLEKFALLKANAQGLSEEEVEARLEEPARAMGVYEIVVERDADAIEKHGKFAKHMAAHL